MIRTGLRSGVVAALFLYGCSVDGGKTKPAAIAAGDHEGDDLGECTDGADNDRDGYFDCDDNGCWGAPDCDGRPEGDADTDADADSDADADADADSDADSDTDTSGTFDPANCSGSDLCDLKTVTITWAPYWDFEGLLLSICDGFGVCMEDCTTTYTGQGDVVEIDVATGRITFFGTYELTSTDCNDTTLGFVAGNVVWTPGPPTHAAYHTFFLNNPTTIRDWFAHGKLQEYTTSANANWYITDMYSTIDLTVTQPQFAWTLVEPDQTGYITIYHDAQATFTK